MSTDNPKTNKAEPEKKDTKIPSADDLTKTSKSGDIELDEEELKRVSGGAGDVFGKIGDIKGESL
jgi:hypothetical protein